jgi:hypothetical protein
MVITNDKQAFGRFLEVYGSIGGKVDEINSFMIKKSIEKHSITIEDIERALFEFYESGEYVNWGNILKHVKNKGYDPEKARQFYNAKPA